MKKSRFHVIKCVTQETKYTNEILKYFNNYEYEVIYLNKNYPEIPETLDAIKYLFNWLSNLKYQSKFAFDRDKIKYSIDLDKYSLTLSDMLMRHSDAFYHVNNLICSILYNQELSIKEKNTTLINYILHLQTRENYEAFIVENDKLENIRSKQAISFLVSLYVQCQLTRRSDFLLFASNLMSGSYIKEARNIDQVVSQADNEHSDNLDNDIESPIIEVPCGTHYCNQPKLTAEYNKFKKDLITYKSNMITKKYYHSYLSPDCLYLLIFKKRLYLSHVGDRVARVKLKEFQSQSRDVSSCIHPTLRNIATPSDNHTELMSPQLFFFSFVLHSNKLCIKIAITVSTPKPATIAATLRVCKEQRKIPRLFGSCRRNKKPYQPSLNHIVENFVVLISSARCLTLNQ